MTHKYSTNLTVANCRQDLSWQLGQYINWLRADKSRRAYVFPKTNRRYLIDQVRNELRFAVGTTVIEVDPHDYNEGTVFDEGAEDEAIAA